MRVHEAWHDKRPMQMPDRTARVRKAMADPRYHPILDEDVAVSHRTVREQHAASAQDKAVSWPIRRDAAMLLDILHARYLQSTARHQPAHTAQ